VKEFALVAFNKLLNSYLGLDPESTRRLQALSGKRLEMRWQETDVSLTLYFTDTGVVATLQPYPEPDTIIIASLWGFLQLGVSALPQTGLLPENVEIHGDVDVAQQVKTLFSHLEIDWEEYLSYAVGDVVAHQMGRAARAIKAFGAQTSDSLTQSVTEYLQEEVSLLPPREAVSDFCREVDELRDDVERFAANWQWWLAQQETEA
jgi:ubiquinone biosynthesis protein UbiJ